MPRASHPSHWKGAHLSIKHREAISASLKASHARRKLSAESDAEPVTAIISVRGVDVDLWLQLRMRALRVGRTAGDCLSEAIREWLEKE